jgi:serine/threonine-protein kinase
MKVTKEDGTFFTETSPYFKLDEIITPFSEQKILKEILPKAEQKRLGAVVFTNQNASVKISTNQGEDEIPVRIGNIIITTPKDLPSEIKKYAKETLGKSSRLTQSIIDTLCEILKGDLDNTDSHEMKIKGRYVFNPNICLENESSDYYKMYLGRDIRKNRLVWIKNYILSTISRESLDDEAIRIGREAEALREFDGSEQVQKYIDSERIGEQYYLILEYVEGDSIDKWLKKEVTIAEKFNTLLSIATIMNAIEETGIPHRAINNKNLRINNEGEAKLINFELCKFDYLPTLPPTARRELDTKFQSREVRSAVSQNITCAADMYSFAVIVCFILSNEIIMTYDEYSRYARNQKKIEEIAQKCKIDYSDFKELIPVFEINPDKRLNAMQLNEILNKWKEKYGR